ncbi:hypothetical protein Hanom_Chr10g00898721 [Helianthus anomalus]
MANHCQPKFTDQIWFHAVKLYRCGKGERKERGGYRVGSIPISTNHTFFLFFLNSLPLHQVFKPLSTFFIKV